MAKIILTAITSRLQRRKYRPLINTSLTFTLPVKDGVAAADAAIVIVASAVNAAF